MTRSDRRLPYLLEIDLTQPLVEVEPEDPLGKLRSRGKPRLRAVLRALHEGANDRHVAGLVAKIAGADSMPVSTAQEIRQAVVAFAASGKPTVAWSETFGESGNGSLGYYLASGFREVWLQPTGELNLIGVAVETTFLRGTLDKLGIEPQLDKRYEYKNAANQMTHTEYTEQHRQSVSRIAESIWDDIVSAVAAGRGLSETAVRAAADAAPLTAEEAVQAGLVDRAGYRDEVYTDVRRRTGDVRLRFADRWTPKPTLTKRVRTATVDRQQPVVALVEGHGGIVTGRNRRSTFDGQQMGSDSLGAAFRAARENDRVKAVVFRVDSPGGSAVASDTMWREVVLTREAGKPVIVSMGQYAASGGYYVSCPADVIVAQPGTLTGSIGVFGGKAVVTGLLDKAGVSSDFVAFGARSRMYSARAGFSDDERERLNRFLDDVYADFTGKVAAGRGMTQSAVHEIAQGRVWTGADAADRGLVDTIGGLRDAARIARERVGLPADAPLRPAIHVPLVAQLKAPQSSEDPRAASMRYAGWGEFAALATALGLPASGPLTMPSLRLR